MADRAPVSTLLRPFRGRVVLLSLLAVVSAFLQVLFALVSKNVVDHAIAGGEDLALWGAALIGLILLLVALYIAQKWLADLTSDKSIASMRLALLRSAVYSRDAHLQGFHSGALLSRSMEDVFTVSDAYVLLVPSVAGQLARLAASFCAVLLLFPPLAGLVLLAAALLVGVMVLLHPVLRRKQSLVRSADEQVMSGMQEPLQQLELIQSLEAQERILQGFDAKLRASLSARRGRRFWTVGYSGFLHCASLLSTGAVLLLCAGSIAGDALTFGALTALLQLLNLIRGPVMGLSGLFTRFSSAQVAAQRLAELFSIPVVAEKTEAAAVRAVVLENVVFTYPGDEIPALDGFSLRIPLDGISCITGVSGHGKSTIFKLLLGLYEPQQGRVYLETETGEIPCGAATRHYFAYVPQDYALFSGTVLDNLLLVAPNAGEAQRRAALHCADADFVWELSAGELTLVRENNAGLSKGQLQRLAIARAILMDRPVFLLDECTSALDAETEQTVMRRLNGLGRSAIMVTHRPEVLRQLPEVRMIRMDAQ